MSRSLTSRIRFVSFDRRSGKFRVQIWRAGQRGRSYQQYIGQYTSEAEAGRAAALAARLYNL